MMYRARHSASVAGLAAVLLAAACSSALKEPPSRAELAPRVVDAGEATLASLLNRAAAELARLPEREAVERARELYLTAASRDEPPIAAFIGAARATAWLVESCDDGAQRALLASEGVQIGQLCRRHFPDQPECRYRLALAVGQQARERPATALDGLEVMVGLLEELIDEAPELDHGGPARVLALVLLRAPGWPSGPGDPAGGLEHARSAAEAFPAYPPNQLVLGEALRDSGQPAAGRRAFEQALALAAALAADGDSEAAGWVAEARSFLAQAR